MEKCKWCEGTGKCPTCDGKGRGAGRPPESFIRKAGIDPGAARKSSYPWGWGCSRCNATGQCPACGGTGWAGMT